MEIPFLIMVTCLIMSIIKLFKKVYKEIPKEIPFLLMITCLIMSTIKLFKKVYKEILKGNSILTNDHVFEHFYYY